MVGNTGSVSISDDGILTEPLGITSQNGMVELQLTGGTVALNSEGKGLQRITVQVATEIPNPTQGYNIIGHIYDMEPVGAIFNPPLNLAMRYDPQTLPEGVTEESLVISYRNGTEWVILKGIVDTEKNTVMVPISHFTKFALIYKLPVTPPSSATPPPPTPPFPPPSSGSEINWVLIGVIFAGILLIGLSVDFILKRRHY